MLSETELEEEILKIKSSSSLVIPPIPVLQPFPKNATVPQKMELIQQYIYKFEYNYTPENYFNVSKRRPYLSLMNTAREIMREALPIKCIEAVILGLYLTNGMTKAGLVRFPIRFKSISRGNVYRHIILGLRYGRKYGAIGISRSTLLEYKSFQFDSLSELVDEYKSCYEKVEHVVKRVSIGIPVDIDEFSPQFLSWTFLICHVHDYHNDWENVLNTFDLYMAEFDKHGIYLKSRVLFKPILKCVSFNSRLYLLSRSTNSPGIKIKENCETSEESSDDSSESEDEKAKDVSKIKKRNNGV